MVQAASKRATDGPFAMAGPYLSALGLSPIPCGGLDGKKPLIGFSRSRGIRPAGAAKLALKFGGENVGVLTAKRSGVTIVDVDDPELIPAMLSRCGETPLLTSTPSGGAHLWYRFDGERNAQRLDGLAVDVRGEGGLVVVPPSVRPDGLSYAFQCGSWADLQHLPKVRHGSLRLGREPRDVQDALPSSDPAELRTVRQGRRNATLYRLLLREVKGCDTEEALLDCARTINDGFLPPLSDAEVAKTAHSAWRCETENRNWVGEEPHISVSNTEFSELADQPSALVLLQALRLAHGARPEPFAVSPKAMAEAESINGWRHPERIQRALRILVERGKLARVYKGGSRKGDPNLYRLTTLGTKTIPNIIEHPSLLFRVHSACSAFSALIPFKLGIGV